MGDGGLKETPRVDAALLFFANTGPLRMCVFCSRNHLSTYSCHYACMQMHTYECTYFRKLAWVGKGGVGSETEAMVTFALRVK